MAWMATPEQMNTLAAVFPYTRVECELYALGSDRPLIVRRDVERVIERSFSPKTVAAIRERQRQCPRVDRAVVYERTVPVLEDKMPLLEYHLGRYFNALRARRGA